jgi:hypothetical protein
VPHAADDAGGRGPHGGARPLLSHEA